MKSSMSVGGALSHFRWHTCGVVLLLLGAASVARAHIYLQLPIIVNVLEGENISDDTIRARVDGMNRILGQCGNISVTLLKINHDWPDPNDPRNGDGLGAVRPDERDQLRNQGEREMARRGAGAKIFVASGLLEGDGSAMAGVNGVTVVNRAVSILNDETGDDRTWAHEFAHGMGLEHTGTPGNLMEDPRPAVGAGTALTPEQCQQIIDGMIRQGVISEETVDQIGQNDRTVSVACVFDDPTEPPINDAFVDLENVCASIVRTPSSATASVTLRLQGLIPDGVPMASYSVVMDTDNNPNTGGQFAGMPGIDRVALVQVSGVYPFFVSGILMALPGNQVLATIPARVRRGFEYAESYVPRPGDPRADSIELSVPLQLLAPLADTMQAGAGAQSLTASDVIPLQPMPTTPPQRPPILVNPQAAYPSQPVLLTGQQFTPNSNVVVSVNHRQLVSLPLNGAGSFNTIFNAPMLPAGDYFLDVIDSEGLVNLKIMRILPVPLELEHVGGKMRLSWPLAAPGFKLQFTRTIHPTDWHDVLDAPLPIGDRWLVETDPEEGGTFYRLKNL